MDSGNPIMFPNTSIFNEDWDEWRPPGKLRRTYQPSPARKLEFSL